MPAKKDVYITFYQKIGNTLFVSNGFSFGREGVKDYTDIFINREASSEEIKMKLKAVPHPIDRVLVSISVKEELKNLYHLLDENWVIGGNVFSNTHRNDLNTVQVRRISERSKALSCTFTSMSLESFLNGPNAPLSSNFDYYFKPLVEVSGCRNLFYNCSIGRGCYWNKCKFCGFKLSNEKRYLRDNATGILKQIPPNTMGGTSQVHTGLPSVGPGILHDILSNDWDRTICPIFFIRADPGIIKVLESFDPADEVCMKKKFCLGIEILSDIALNILNKGTTVDNILRTIELLLSHRAMVELEIMINYPFLDPQIVDEAVEGYQRLKKLYRQYDGPPNYIWFYNNGEVLWPSKDIVFNYTDVYEKIECIHDAFDEVEPTAECHHLYRAIIQKDSDMVYYNRVVEEAIVDTGIMISRS